MIGLFVWYNIICHYVVGWSFIPYSLVDNFNIILQAIFHWRKKTDYGSETKGSWQIINTTSKKWNCIIQFLLVSNWMYCACTWKIIVWLKLSVIFLLWLVFFFFSFLSLYMDNTDFHSLLKIQLCVYEKFKLLNVHFLCRSKIQDGCQKKSLLKNISVNQKWLQLQTRTRF